MWTAESTLGAARTAGAARAPVELALGAGAVGTALGLGLPISFRPVRGAGSVAPLIVPALAVTVLRARAMGGVTIRAVGMTLLPVVAVAALLAVVAAVGLGRGTTLPLLRASLRGWLQTLERFRVGGEVRR